MDNEIVFSNKNGDLIKYHVTTEVGGNESTPSEDVSLWGDALWKELVNNASQLPEEFALHSAFPNPFNMTFIRQIFNNI